MFYRQGFSKCSMIVLNDFDHYYEYDVALFMSYKNDLSLMAETKKRFPFLKMGVCDPRSLENIKKHLDCIDFFIVDSIEMTDFWANYGKPICQYVEYFDCGQYHKIHKHKRELVLGYHGNLLHLAGMFPKVTQAIDKLSEKYDLELWAVYDAKKLGFATFGLPSKVKIRHIQWHRQVYQEELSKVDIGLAPALMPLYKTIKSKKKLEVYKKFFLDSEDDYLLRFKMPTNLGRIIVFARLGIPVVADFYPSALQLIENGKNGFLAVSSGAWYRALEALIKDYHLRGQIADAMRKKVNKLYDYKYQNEHFLKFLEHQFSIGWQNSPEFDPKLQEKQYRSLYLQARKRNFVRKYFNPAKKRFMKIFRSKCAES